MVLSTSLAPELPDKLFCKDQTPQPTTPAISLESLIGWLRNWQQPATRISEDLGLAASVGSEVPETVKIAQLVLAI